jgi:hypothetical protein
VASVWAGPIVTVVEAERELVMKSPAFARSVSVPSGTPLISKLPPAEVRVDARKSGPWALTFTPVSCASGRPTTAPRTSAPSASVSWTSCASSPVTTASAGALVWSRSAALRL